MHVAIKSAAITGAAAGIGRALAVRLASEGCRLAICDVDEAGLTETARIVAATGSPAEPARVDVADAGAVREWADRTVAQLGAPALVVNNAGVVLSGAVEAVTYEDFDWLMRVNFWGVVHGTKAFLPHLKRAGGGCIVNMSSAFGLIGIPTQAPYSASKFAVRGFTEALAQELEIEGSRVRAVCVYPGGVRTGLVRSGRMAGADALGLGHDEVVLGFERLARMSAEAAAGAIVDGVKRNRRRILVGADARFVDVVQRLFPSFYQRIVVIRARRARRDRRKFQASRP